MGIFLCAGMMHTALPEYRWVLIHLFTLGILTNSVIVWSQHLTEKFVQQRLDDAARPAQLRRIQVLNAGVVLVLVGQLLTHVWHWHFLVTQLGALIVAAMVAWHGVSLLKQWSSADPTKRFRPIILGYVGSAFCLPVGAFLGATLAVGLPEPWYSRLLFSHIACNVAGFVGLAAAASLSVLFPSIWRTKGITTRMPLTLILLGSGVAITALGAGLGWMPAAAIGLIVYAAGWVASVQQWLGNVAAVLANPRDRINYPSASILAAVSWLTLTIVYFAVRLLITGDPLPLPTLALLVGFAGQLLIGVMSYLLPTTMGGGPGATRTGLAALNTLGLARVTLTNGGLIIWLLTDKSWLAVAASAVCLLPLAVFPFLLVRAIRAQRAVITKKAEPVMVAATPPWGQVSGAAAVLAVLLAAFGGI